MGDSEGEQPSAIAFPMRKTCRQLGPFHTFCYITRSLRPPNVVVLAGLTWRMFQKVTRRAVDVHKQVSRLTSRG